MIAFLTLCYVGFVWLIFMKLKLLPWGRATQAVVATVGIVGIFLLIVLMGLYQPQSVSATVSQRVVPIVARVQGRVVEVPIEPNVVVHEGAVLMRIDPVPYQADVDRLAAALAEAEQAVPQLKAQWDAAVAVRAQAAADRDLARIDRDLRREAHDRGAATDIEMQTAEAKLTAKEAGLQRAVADETRAQLAYQSEIGGVNTTVARIRADLTRARYFLEECTIRAPTDGYVTQRFVEEGAVTLTAPLSSVMSFVYADDLTIRAIFRGNAAHHMKAGDIAEVTFDTIPGMVFAAELVLVAPATGSGALSPSGDLQTTEQLSQSDLVLAQILITDERFDAAQTPIGTAATVGVYTDGAAAIRIIRKVVLRMQAWLNYL